MFTEYIYNVDGRERSRFFQSWNKANEELTKECNSLLENHPGAKLVYNNDYFNSCKGIPVREIMIIINNSSFILSLITCYFEDDLI